MPSKYYLEVENRNLKGRITKLEHDMELERQHRRSELAQKDGYIRAFKTLIKIFPQFAAYRRKDAEDDWGTLYSDLIAEDMERIHTNRDDARKRRLFGEKTREK